jgi:hypothetical protein
VGRRRERAEGRREPSTPTEGGAKAYRAYVEPRLTEAGAAQQAIRAAQQAELSETPSQPWRIANVTMMARIVR